MFTRLDLLEAVNRINQHHAATKVGFINGYHDQWLIGAHLNGNESKKRIITLRFCQGRNTGRINFNGGYPVELDVTHCNNELEVLREFELLDHHKRTENEKLEARCSHCIHYLRRLTGGCEPSQSCGYKRLSRKKNISKSTIESEESNETSLHAD